ncbi:superoxide dismutase [Paenibacillus alkalitolerans]|uniref:superoxide dismutase n=1 Tax=Paenibacillus alkalitolerans TaxID=2799335 RepID=UPI001F285D05|nr:superoxide dismutase [Paenibacillus alkalitolerans]
MNSYNYTHRDPIQACKSIAEWCSQGIDYVSFIRLSRKVPEGCKNSLDYWEYAFRNLAAKAENVLWSNTTRYHPKKLAELIHQSQMLHLDFTRFLQTNAISNQNDPELHKEKWRADNNSMNAVPIGEHTLPPLPYDYNALEPYIDEKTMRLHHDKHHKSYVDGLNKAEKMMEKARRTGDFELIAHWEREAAFNGAGHYLHTIFWNNMSPQGGGEPTGSLSEQIAKVFGSFSAFKKHFSSAAEKVEAVGWAILVWAPRSHRLEILQAEKHQNLSQWDVIPLLVLDVWEHAYYLKYQNDRKAYIDAWWNVVNWSHVKERFEKARTITWTPY